LSVKIRLSRMGSRKKPFYRIVVADIRSPRDGRFIDKIGIYDPKSDPSRIEVDKDKALEWIKKGAKPTDTVQKLFDKIDLKK